MSYRKNFVGTQKRVRISHDKRAIGVRAIEVRLYMPSIGVDIALTRICLEIFIAYCFHMLHAVVYQNYTSTDGRYVIVRYCINAYIRSCWKLCSNGAKSMYSLRKHAYSNILKISPPKIESFPIKILIVFIFLLKT